MAVVKADGYGHGATPVARAALAAGAAELGVATVDEALELRAAGITAPVLAWLHPPGIDFGPALLADVQIAVSSVRQLDELMDAARRTGRTAITSVKVDTGLNRNGVAAAQFPSMLTALQQAVAEGAIGLRGLMSHLVFADQLIEHLHPVDAEAIHRDIFTALRPGGAFICYSPNRLLGPHDLTRYFDGEAPEGLHLREYSLRELAELLRRQGFARVRPLVGARSLWLPAPLWLLGLVEDGLAALSPGARRRQARAPAGRPP